ncbi:hypothetical protein PLESTF_000684800 [Pleodorina starrii]|nr:hypothetical protein PLESTF_000684800 [Pleodorina starrii]
MTMVVDTNDGSAQPSGDAARAAALAIRQKEVQEAMRNDANDAHKKIEALSVECVKLHSTMAENLDLLVRIVAHGLLDLLLSDGERRGAGRVAQWLRRAGLRRAVIAIHNHRHSGLVEEGDEVGEPPQKA